MNGRNEWQCWRIDELERFKRNARIRKDQLVDVVCRGGKGKWNRRKWSFIVCSSIYGGTMERAQPPLDTWCFIFADGMRYSKLWEISYWDLSATRTLRHFWFTGRSSCRFCTCKLTRNMKKHMNVSSLKFQACVSRIAACTIVFVRRVPRRLITCYSDTLSLGR